MLCLAPRNPQGNCPPDPLPSLYQLRARIATAVTPHASRLWPLSHCGKIRIERTGRRRPPWPVSSSCLSARCAPGRQSWTIPARMGHCIRRPDQRGPGQVSVGALWGRLPAAGHRHPQSAPAWEYLTRTLSDFCAARGLAAPAFRPVPLEEEQAFAQEALPVLLAHIGPGDTLLLETTGGFRNAMMYLLLLSRILSYTGVPVAEAVYSNFQSREISSVSQFFSMFQLAEGMQNLSAFGSVETLRAYYAGRPQPAGAEALLCAMERLTEAIALCRTRQIDACMEQFNAALAQLEGARADRPPAAGTAAGVPLQIRAGRPDDHPHPDPLVRRQRNAPTGPDGVHRADARLPPLSRPGQTDPAGRERGRPARPAAPALRAPGAGLLPAQLSPPVQAQAGGGGALRRLPAVHPEQRAGDRNRGPLRPAPQAGARGAPTRHPAGGGTGTGGGALPGEPAAGTAAGCAGCRFSAPRP